MGNIFEKKSKTEVDIDELKKRLYNLEKIDSNKDGIVSKNEFNEWSKKQKKDIEKFKKSIEEKAETKYQKMLLDNERELNDKKLEIKELQKELEALKKINHSLEHSIKNEESLKSESVSVNVESNKQKLSELSKQRINKFVETLLEDEDINIKYFPDVVERQIYRNVFTILVNLLDTLFETSSVNFMGHKLEFDLKPLEEDELSNSDEYCDYEG